MRLKVRISDEAALTVIMTVIATALAFAVWQVASLITAVVVPLVECAS